jgi:hypothetical protein
VSDGGDPTESPSAGSPWFRRPWFVVVVLVAVAIAVLVALLVGGGEHDESGAPSTAGLGAHLTARMAASG